MSNVHNGVFDEHVRICGELGIAPPKETDLIADTVARVAEARNNISLITLNRAIREANDQLIAMEGIDLLYSWSENGDEPELREILKGVLDNE